jgi:hypothetical protein
MTVAGTVNMRTFHIPTVTAIPWAMLVLAVTAASQQPFVGTITYDVTMKGKHIQLVATTSGTKLRQEVRVVDTLTPAYAYAVIVDYASGDIITLMPLTKRYAQRNFRNDDPPPGPRGGGVAPPRLWRDTLIATGRRETVAGVECEIYATSGGLEFDEYWLTTALGRIAVLDSVAAHVDVTNGALPPVMRIFKGAAIALRVRMSSADSPVEMIATKIDRTKPPPTVFEPPPGYVRIQDR